jgi:hypothetical protein
MSLVPHGRLLTCPAGCDSNAIKSFGFPYSTPISLQMRWSMYYSQNHGFKSRELHVRGTIVGVNSAARMRFECHKKLWLPFLDTWSSDEILKRPIQQISTGKVELSELFSHLASLYFMWGTIKQFLLHRFLLERSSSLLKIRNLYHIL